MRHGYTDGVARVRRLLCPPLRSRRSRLGPELVTDALERRLPIFSSTSVVIYGWDGCAASCPPSGHNPQTATMRYTIPSGMLNHVCGTPSRQSAGGWAIMNRASGSMAAICARQNTFRAPPSAAYPRMPPPTARAEDIAWYN